MYACRNGFLPPYRDLSKACEMDNKPFHKYKTQVKLVIDSCILHNWILGFGTDEHVPSEDGFTSTLPDPHDTDSQEQVSVVMSAKIQ